MQLKSLELFGFKSFADKTKLVFDKGITGIVGPNGCGKSNIIDAIRWVLGEQSTKSLRSDKMEEVIFNGNDKRKRSNLAEVSITFENTKNLLPTEFTSITITRKLFREGNSEYYLNNVPCRLKDIESLLLDTGIGPDSYAIIELKMVDELLNDKNNTRRELFDEAAGISKYKIRKKETLKRLESTEQDLTRVEDILSEIEKNLKNLEKQAKKAEKYLELKNKYRLLSSQYVYLKSINILNQEKEILNQQNQIHDQILEIQTKSTQYDSMLQELHKQLLLQEELLVKKQKNLNEVNEFIQNQESEKKLQKEKLKFISEKIENLKNALDKATHNKTQIYSELEHFENELDKENENYDKLEFYLQELEENLSYDQNQVKIRKLQLDELNEKIQKKQAYLSQIEKNLNIQKIKLDNIDNELQKNSNEKEQKKIELRNFTEQLENEKNNIISLETQILEVQNLLNENKNKEKNLLDSQNALQKQIQEVQLIIEKKKNEHQLVKSLIDNMEGYSESTKFLLRKKDWAKQVAILSDIFSCPEEYKAAIEGFLEPYLNYFIVQNYMEALEAIHLLKEKNLGKAQFFILDEIQNFLDTQLINQFPSTTTNLQPVLDVLHYDEKYFPLAKFLFQNTYFVENTFNFKDLDPNFVYLSRSGNYIYGQAKIIGGSVGLFEGKKIGRKKDLEILQKTIQENENTLKLLRQNLISIQTELQNLPIQSLEKLLKELQHELLKLQKNYSILEFKQNEFNQFIQKTDIQKNELETEFQKLKIEILKNTQTYETIEEELNVLQNEYNQQNKQYNIVNQRFIEQQNVYNQTNLQFLQVKNKVQSIRQEIKFRRENLVKIEENISEWSNELNTLEIELQNISQKINEEDVDLVNLYEKRDLFKKQLAEQEEIVRNLKNSIHRYENQIKELRNQKEKLTNEIEKLKEKLTEIKIQWNAISERFQVEFNIKPEELNSKDLFNSEELPEEEIIYQQVLELRENLHHFGEVNTMAVEAYKEIKERYDFIVSQRTDILKAKHDLLQTISEIERSAKEQFLNAFHAIRENFIRVFRSLFTKEDTCDLILLDPENPTESAIDIIAKPKGKKPLNINQLSGGEKTLTATSLLFAIYLYKPAPFCIFDEVDAPLDDANIDKFNNIIRDFSKESQFIIVTHNKRTMVTTHVIYGVTMEEMGVSKVLPVSLVDLKLT